MRRLYIFRTNLRNLEDYHLTTTLSEFKEKCWDFYLMMGLWYVENDCFDEVIIWRLKNNNQLIEESQFEINGRKFIQKWVLNFSEVFQFPKPDVTLFRGGFLEYDEITKMNPSYFGLKLYLAAGKRIVPQYGGIYDKILIEDERDNIKNSIPFYKTANPNIFKNLNIEKDYDLCIVSNFKQLKYKGSDLIINQIPKRQFFQDLKICHIGNEKKIGIELCEKRGVKNVDFLGSFSRDGVNKILNRCKFAIVASNREDGCPRVITESLCSETPLFIREETRCLNYYKKYGVIPFTNEGNFFRCLFMGFDHYKEIKESLQKNIDNLSMDTICNMNINLWRN